MTFRIHLSYNQAGTIYTVPTATYERYHRNTWVHPYSSCQVLTERINVPHEYGRRNKGSLPHCLKGIRDTRDLNDLLLFLSFVKKYLPNFAEYLTLSTWRVYFKINFVIQFTCRLVTSISDKLTNRPCAEKHRMVVCTVKALKCYVISNKHYSHNKYPKQILLTYSHKKLTPRVRRQKVVRRERLSVYNPPRLLENWHRSCSSKQTFYRKFAS